MSLLILNYSEENKTLQDCLGTRPWKKVWMTAFDLDAVTTRIACGDIDQILIQEKHGVSTGAFQAALQKSFPDMPIVVVSPSEPMDSHLLAQKLEEGFKLRPTLQHYHQVWNKNKESLPVDPRFFKSIDLFHVIDRMFSFFSQRLLCEDIHWIFHADLDGFLKQDIESLGLELEADYKKSHRLRSLNEQIPIETLKWLRELPLEKFEKDKPAVISHHYRQHLWLPIKDQGKLLGFLVFRAFESGDIEVLLDKWEDSVQMMSRFVSFAIQMWDAQSLALVDDLTDLHNQRYLPRALDREIARAKRLNKKFTMLFMDVDFFKRVNDTSGHWVGSRILVEMGKLFRDSLRTCDYAFRYGGDEFVAILVDSDAEASMTVAERLRKKIESTPFVIDGQSFNVTVSIGLACYPDHAQTRQQIIELADEAMYQGKNKSRNIVHVAS